MFNTFYFIYSHLRLVAGCWSFVEWISSLLALFFFNPTLSKHSPHVSFNTIAISIAPKTHKTPQIDIHPHNRIDSKSGGKSFKYAKQVRFDANIMIATLMFRIWKWKKSLRWKNVRERHSLMLNKKKSCTFAGRFSTLTRSDNGIIPDAEMKTTSDKDKTGTNV